MLLVEQKNSILSNKSAKFISAMVICHIIIFFLTIGLYFNNRIVIFTSFILTLLGLFFSKRKNLLNYILFFIPTANIFKLTYSSFSFYTFICLFTLCLFITIYSKEVKYDIRQLIVIIILLCYSGLQLLNQSFSIFEFFGFFINLVLVSIFSHKENKLIDLKRNSLAFAFGVLSSSVSGIILQDLPHMRVYLDIDTIYYAGLSMSRFVGLVGDPNIYSMQVAISLALLLTVNISKKGTMPRLVKLIFIALSMFGFLSLSKTYIITWCLIILCWFFGTLKHKNIKDFFVFFLLVIMAIFLNTKFGFLNKLVNFYLFRFGNYTGGYGDSLDTLTTGRAYIWRYYLNEIFTRLNVFLFGTGLNRSIRPMSPHNTYLSIFYAFGFIGTFLLIVYIARLFISQSSNLLTKYKGQKLILGLLPLFIYLIFIASLDLLFEDYFMLLLLLQFNALHSVLIRE